MAIEQPAPTSETTDDYPHEIHISIAPPDNPRLFLRVCEELGVRPCVFDNEFANGQHLTDYLTASDYRTTTEAAMTEMRRLGQAFVESGLSVVREKIETSPTNPVSPRRDKDSPTPHQNSYFETHFDVHEIGRDWLGRLALVQLMGPEEPILLSVNRKKPDEFLATYRVYGTYYEDYMERFVDVRAKLADHYDITTADTEFAAYDSNPQHDKAWYESYKRMVVDK